MRLFFILSLFRELAFSTSLLDEVYERVSKVANRGSVDNIRSENTYFDSQVLVGQQIFENQLR